MLSLRRRMNWKRCPLDHRPVTNAARVFCGGSRVRPFLAAGAAIILAGACDPFGFVPAPPVRSTS
jgi:hypothetical protein